MYTPHARGTGTPLTCKAQDELIDKDVITVLGFLLPTVLGFLYPMKTSSLETTWVKYLRFISLNSQKN